MKIKEINSKNVKLIPQKQVGGLISKGQWGLVARVAAKALPRIAKVSPKLSQKAGNLISKAASKTTRRGALFMYGTARAAGKSKEQAGMYAATAARQNYTNAAYNSATRALPRGTKTTATTGATVAEDVVRSLTPRSGLSKAVSHVGWLALPATAVGLAMSYAENDDKKRELNMQAKQMGYANYEEALADLLAKLDKLRLKLANFGTVKVINDTPSVEGNGYLRFKRNNLSNISDNGSKNTAIPTSTTDILTTISGSADVTIPTSTATTGDYTIQRGDTLSKLAQQYGTTVEELAKLNNISNINRIYAGRTLKLPGIQNTLQNVLTETPKPTSYGFGVTDSNLKLGTNNLYYPESNSDDLLREAFASKGLNFDDYKNLTASKLPTGIAPVSTEVKSFAPNPQLESNNIKEQARVAAYRKKIIDSMPEKLIGLPTVARTGIKLIKRNK